MQAIEKIDISTNWTTIIFVLLLLCVFLLKGFNSEKLKGYFFAFFSKGFIISEIEERKPLINRFSIVFTTFSALNIALLLSFVFDKFIENRQLSFQFFLKVALIVLFYLIFKWVLEQLLVMLFSISAELKFFLTAKNIYLQALTLWFFPFVIFLFYSKFNEVFSISIISLLLLLRFFLILKNNKNLILNKLFYFILYLCAFEIAPLFILFKFLF